MGLRLCTRCMRAAAGWAKGAVPTPPSTKKQGFVKPHPILEHLFSRVTGDLLSPSGLDDEEFH